MEVVRDIWPVMISLFLSGVVGIMVFPFFTYVPSSGWLDDLLPKVRAAISITALLVLVADFSWQTSCAIMLTTDLSDLQCRRTCKHVWHGHWPHHFLAVACPALTMLLLPVA